VSAAPGKIIDQALEHRAQREEQLLNALASGPRKLDDLLVEVYKGVPKPLMKFARLQLLAGLQKLQGEGEIEVVGESSAQNWSLVPARRQE
jgi:hypothetical protein